MIKGTLVVPTLWPIYKYVLPASHNEQIDPVYNFLPGFINYTNTPERVIFEVQRNPDMLV
jgi:hypothetical protein